MLKKFKRSLNSVLIPALIYGTAWKEEATQALTFQALKNGFEGIDTANQRKHYYEEGVGLGIQQFLKESGKNRSDIFLQTKFTSAFGQDHRRPYDEADPIAIQIIKSFESSLIHLKTNYIDSYILHGPKYASGLAADDLEAWTAMEGLVNQNKVKFLGISNVNLEQLKELYKRAVTKPVFVQNRCFANTHWDQDIRQFCSEHKIIYQGFSLLTANLQCFSNPKIQEFAKKYKKTIPQIIFRFALQSNILPLIGTTNQQHMQEDLNLDSFELAPQELIDILGSDLEF